MPLSILCHVYTLLVVAFGWVWFRVDSATHAMDYFAALFGLSGDGMISLDLTILLQPSLYLAFILGGLLSLARRQWMSRFKSRMATGLARAGWTKVPDLSTTGRGMILTGLLVLCAFGVSAATYNPFLSFRF